MTGRRIQVHLRVEGALPPGYRTAMQLFANKNKLLGWVRIGEDGSVEATVQGDEAAVAAAERWCSRGPLAAGVLRVTRADQPREAFFGFDVRP